MPLLSMTGFASIAREISSQNVALELRAVNHRYLDVQMRLPEELRYLEGGVRERLAARFSRGKVEVRINVQAVNGDQAQLEVSWPMVSQLLDIQRRVLEQAPQAQNLSVGEILRWPGVAQAQTAALDPEAFATAVYQLLDEAITDLTASRGREGEKLGQFLLDRVARMEELVIQIRPKVPEMVAAMQEKLAAKLKEFTGGVDNERLHQEVVLFAQRVDIEEELGRLSSHVAEVRRIVKSSGAVGKRLDFMMQELNREANTLGSKSASTDSTAVALELKVLIEQMREQVQNIE